MDHTRRDRALSPSGWKTRCINAGEVHEFINVGPDPRYPVDYVEYYGFAEFQNSGVLAVGDALEYAGNTLGFIAGFDETHMPNHYNILVRGTVMANGHHALQNGSVSSTTPREALESEGLT